MIPISLLELVRVREGHGVSRALADAATVARRAEAAGFNRIWVAEHHNMMSVASAATSVVIAHLAAATSTIRVGAGGIMLPNHSPLVIAEQFGTLEALFPGRIDLGLGRAPGTDQIASRAMRVDAMRSQQFPQEVQELQALLAPAQEGQRLIANPGAGVEVPLWILGSSTFGAQLAAMLGLPYAFASHFAPAALHAALRAYRQGFQPSSALARPHAMIGVNVIVADSDEEARRLATTQQMGFTEIFRGTRGFAKPPIDDIEAYWSPAERAQVMQMLSCSVVGSPATVKRGLSDLLASTGADELMIVSETYDLDARLRSLDMISNIARDLDREIDAAA
ncbi:LLM class flavin-dependent oxidoreductase [Sphingomonas sp. ID0503]|uniref:LLM class flavin-dependent oxidoreductase n=1 Tax=Sphingomonas sp. ID0503 TaxID=3399691 RepID=UPI003AFA308E